MSEIQHREQYTTGGDSASETFIRSLLDETVEKIRTRSNPIGIYLQGSFGRGEGTVLTEDLEQPKLWRDLDLTLIYRTRERPSVLSEIENELMQFPGVEGGEKPTEGAEISLIQLPRFLAHRWRDIKMMDLSENSHLLWGEDIRSEMAVRDGQVPIESGERFLLQKAMGLVHVHPDTAGTEFETFYEISKLYIEIAAALSIVLDAPSPNFESNFEEMSSAGLPFPDLVGRIDEWSKVKLEGDSEPPTQDVSKAWHQGVKDLFLVLDFLNKKNPRSSIQPGKKGWGPPYRDDLSSRLIPTIVASVVSRQWPSPWHARTISKVAASSYYLISNFTQSGALDGKRDPLSTVYCSALVSLQQLDAGKTRITIPPGLRLVGFDASYTLDSWSGELSDSYRRVANPLYGVT